MSLYREPGRRRRRRQIGAGVAVVAGLAIAGIVVLATRDSGPPSRADHVAAVRAAASQASDGLDLVTIEYGQAVRNGKVVAPTEYQAAQADLSRAQDAITKARKDIAATAPIAAAPALAALREAAAVVRRRGDATALARAVAGARAALRPLGR
jgi:hypothetical protein